MKTASIPGLANDHSHAFHRALRGRTQEARGNFWTWRDQMYEVANRLTPDTYFALASATYAEMVLAGITSVTEFHYVHHQPNGRPYANPNAMSEALIAAAEDAGVRITVLDTCYLHGGLDRFRDASADAWIERSAARKGGEHVTLGAAIHSVRAVGPNEIERVAQWAGEQGIPLHAHVSEQPIENEMCREQYGKSPTELLADCGALSDSFTAVHCTHVTARDIELLNTSGSTVCFCPTTERDLADGLGPAKEFERLTLGSDSQAVIDLLEEARALEMNERLRTGTRGVFTPNQLLGAAARNKADKVTITLESVRTAGGGDLIFTATGTDITDVVVGGKEIVSEGKHRTIDVPAELARAIAALI